MARRLSGNFDVQLSYKDCCGIEKARCSHTKCPACSANYCSEECRQEAYDQYHEILCLGAAKEDSEHPFNQIDEIWRNMHYPPETTTIWLICRMIATVVKANDPDKVLKQYSSFCSSPVNLQDKMAHKLLGENFKENLEVLRNMLMNTFYNQRIEHWLSPDGFPALMAMIGMNGQGIGTSSLSRYVHNIDALEMDEHDRKFVDAQIDQLYEDIEKGNHSCAPNAEVTFPHNNSTLVLVAIKDIEQDEEICISYLDECQRERSRHSRQKILRENYLFQCSCPVCESQIDTANQTSSEEEEDYDEDDQ
eukprot:gene12225-2857_t